MMKWENDTAVIIMTQEDESLFTSIQRILLVYYGKLRSKDKAVWSSTGLWPKLIFPHLFLKTFIITTERLTEGIFWETEHAISKGERNWTVDTAPSSVITRFMLTRRRQKHVNVWKTRRTSKSLKKSSPGENKLQCLLSDSFRSHWQLQPTQTPVTTQRRFHAAHPPNAAVWRRLFTSSKGRSRA